jgi:hypothetical protein
MARRAARRDEKPCPGHCRADNRRGRSDRNRLSRVKIAAALEAGGQDLDSIVLSIEAKLRRAGKGKRFVIENGAETEVNEGLVELIKEAFAIRNQFLSGSDNSIEAMRTPRNEQVPANFPHSTFSRANLEGGGIMTKKDTRTIRRLSPSPSQLSRTALPPSRFFEQMVFEGQFGTKDARHCWLCPGSNPSSIVLNFAILLLPARCRPPPLSRTIGARDSGFL